MAVLPDTAAEREQFPLAEGLLFYFPAALAAVANCSVVGQAQHNPGKPLRWDRTKSTNHADKIMRHLLDAGEIDVDGVRHTAKVAWRALAMLQEELEANGYPKARNAIENNEELPIAIMEERERCAKICEAMRPFGGRIWTQEQHTCFNALTDAAQSIRDGLQITYERE